MEAAPETNVTLSPVKRVSQINRLHFCKSAALFNSTAKCFLPSLHSNQRNAVTTATITIDKGRSRVFEAKVSAVMKHAELESASNTASYQNYIN